MLIVEVPMSYDGKWPEAARYSIMRTDIDIKRDVEEELRSNPDIDATDIAVAVKDGWITLEGQVEWNYARERAESSVRRVRGVKGVANLIEVSPRVAPSEVKRKIEDSFRRNAELDADRITVEADGSVVRLRGTVRSWAEREEAARVAWRVPGVTKVENFIAIGS